MLNLNWMGAKIPIRNSQGCNWHKIIHKTGFFEINTHTDEVQHPISFYIKITTNVARPSCGATDRFSVFQQLNLITYWHWSTLHVAWKSREIACAQRVYFLLRSFCVNEEWGNHIKTTVDALSRFGFDNLSKPTTNLFGVPDSPEKDEGLKTRFSQASVRNPNDSLRLFVAESAHKHLPTTN